MSNLTKYAVPEGEYGNGTTLEELHVNMSNLLVRAAHGLNLVEKRIVMACVSQLDSMRVGEREDYSQSLVKLSAKEYGDNFGIDMKNAYSELKSASERLFERYIVMMRKTPKGMKEHKFRWVSGVLYQEGAGKIELNFTREVMPYLTLLRNNYTSYSLGMASALRSVYSWRLLELFKSWETTKELFITLEDFRRTMEIPESYLYKDVRVKCIDVAVKELQEKNNLNITWTPIKKSRAVTSLRFKWKEDDQIKLKLEGGEAAKPIHTRKEKQAVKIDKAFIERHARPGETYDQARERLTNKENGGGSIQ
ncbi:replication initiation protein (plasmid) [Thiothrix lacustris]|uniref:Replication initiation protein n=1 Tax=Thiothrix lacustris TaxID=525917 RepID=A0ABY9MVB9_9GAMM|nr:replication initiation protein [Thiothrix lacustris]WML92537.1 replication initiation protein [Thiothrix lacustris]